MQSSYVIFLTQFHAIKAAKTATKKARQFELQRHVRQLKQCQSGKTSKEQSVEELEEELNILKRMDIQQVATNALVSKLVKSKLLPRPQLAISLDAERAKDFPILETARNLGLDPTQKSGYDSVREERVVHQVQSAKVLAEELASCIKSVAALVFPPAPKDTASKATEPNTSAQGDEEVAPVQPAKKAKSKEAPAPVPEEDDYSSDDGFGDEDTERVTNQQWNLSDMDKLDALVGSGSDESDDEDDADSDSDDEGNSSDYNPSRRAKRPRSESPEDDNFLPSLATGFIPAAADDDWNDAEADFADQDASGKGPAKSMRKNRRGQRERRAYVFYC